MHTHRFKYVFQFFETGSGYVAQASPEFPLLLRPPECCCASMLVSTWLLSRTLKAEQQVLFL